MALCLLGGSIALLGGAVALGQLVPEAYIGAQRAYVAELERQLAELDSLTANRRIVLIGSSHVLLGLSAEQIEAATGTPTRNLAMNTARQVFHDYAAMVVEHMRPGDVAIVVSPNLMRLPRMQLPLRCVKQFGFECMRKQDRFRIRPLEDALVLFTNRAFGYQEIRRTPHGDMVFPETFRFAAVSSSFRGPFPVEAASTLVEIATDIRRQGGCPIFAFTPILPEAEEIAQWQNEFAKLWLGLDEAGLHQFVMHDSPLWSDPSLFHHNEHPSERGREVWSQSVISKLRESRLPGGCGQIDANSGLSAATETTDGR